MNRRKVSILAIITGTMLCSGATATWASETDAVTGASPHAGQEQMGEWQTRRDQFTATMNRRADELGITAQQRSDLQIIATDYAARFRDLAKLGRDSAKELLEMAPDAEAYREMTQEASALAASSAAELVTLLAEMRGKLYSVLTPEQRDQLRAMLQSHHPEKEQAQAE